MEELLKHFIKQTDERFKEVKGDLSDINSKIDQLHEFRVKTMASAWWISFIASSICGFVTMLVTAYFSNR